jgi:hypothetical protein
MTQVTIDQIAVMVAMGVLVAMGAFTLGYLSAGQFVRNNPEERHLSKASRQVDALFEQSKRKMAEAQRLQKLAEQRQADIVGEVSQ